MGNTNKTVLSTLVADEGTRFFIPLDKYLRAPSLPKDDPAQRHEWFPLFVSYQRELDVKEELDKKDFETFLPMTIRFKKVNRRVISHEEPAIHNLIFVKSYYERIRWMKMYNRICTSIQFMSHGAQTVQDTIIPSLQMERFICASRKAVGNDRALYLKPEDIEEFKGKEVKFIKGDFEGIEGYVQRVNKNKMVIVTLKGIQSIALPIYRKDELMFI